MTVADIIKVARRILLDTVEPYRWTHEEMRESLQMGISALHCIRPETMYVNDRLTDGIVLPEYDPAEDPGDVKTEIPIHMRFKEALAYYICYMCYRVDDADTVSFQQAEDYLGKFQTKAQI